MGAESVKVRVEDLRVGCILSRDVMGKTSYPIMSAKTVLTEGHIEILHAFLIAEVEIHRIMESGELFQGTESIAKKVVISQTESLFIPELSFKEAYIQAVQKYKREFQSWQSGVGVNIGNIRSMLLSLYEIAEEDKDWIRHIHLYSKKDEYLYHHAIAVGMIASFIADKLGYEKGQCLQVAFAGCLADCGMAKIPTSTLMELGSLTESGWKEIKQHPVLSYNMVKDISVLRPETKLAIYQHHERLNGTGYPRREKRNRIHPQSQILAIADVYHAMTTERLYKTAKSPFKVLQIMEEELFGQFNILTLKELVSAMTKLPMGTVVKLSDSSLAEIMFIKSETPTRPLVKILVTGEMLDLEKNRNLYIQEVIQEKYQ